MRIRVHRPALCALLAGAAFPAAGHACSRAPFPAFRDGVHLVATATADTLRTGAGGVRYHLWRGGTDPDPAGVHGQVVRVERLGGTSAAGLPAGVDRVVLVPWGYGEDCRTLRWSESARWVEPGTRGLFWAGLRPREQWVDGIPTLDVGEPYQLPYTDAGTPYHDGDGAGPPLGVDQAFDLIGLLPEFVEYEADPEAAWRPLLEWARAHPGLAHRYPASMLADHAGYAIRHARLKRIRPPLAGTYRFTVSVDGGAPRTFYARSRSAPTTEWDPAENQRMDADGDGAPPPDAPFRGYTLLLAGALAADSLPVDCGPDRDMGREGYISVFAEPDSVVGGMQVWRGTMELGLVSAQFSGDAVLGLLGRAGSARYSRRAGAGEPVEVLARFLLRPDGSVSMEQTHVLDDGRVVVIRGERISTVTIPDPG